MATAPIFVPALASVGDLVPHDGLLSPEELEQVAVEIVDRPDLWEPLVRTDPEHRRYELIYEDERMDAWVLSWMPGQGTGFHDHYISRCRALLRRRRRPGGPPRVRRQRHASSTCAPATRAPAAQGTSTGCATTLGAPAVTIHVYSPRLDWVGQYRLAENGIVRREVRPGRNELTDQLISEGALEYVLERF